MEEKQKLLYLFIETDLERMWKKKMLQHMSKTHPVCGNDKPIYKMNLRL